MPRNPTAEAMLAAVTASPQAVAAHDKAAWVNLFTSDATVNDPVGARPHTGRAAIERFYDTFIAPNTIAFDVTTDIVIVSGSDASVDAVSRDLTIHTTMSTGATVAVPMHLRYDLVNEAGAWKIARLAAHWELASMIVALLRTGLPGLGAALRLGPQLISNQGVAGAMGMMRALTSVGQAGKRATTSVFTAAAAGDSAALARLLGDAAIEIPTGTPLPITEFADQARNMQWDKLIAAGRTVSATVAIGGVAGVAYIEFAADAPRILSLRIDLATRP